MQENILVKVIDPKHPYYDKTCHILGSGTDIVYPIAIVGEKWHSSYAREDQLQVVDNLAMNTQELEQLEKNVLAHRYRQQETYQLDGTRYVLEKGTTSSPERWMLWIYAEAHFADFVAGDSLKEVFTEAQRKGLPVEILTLDKWHN